MKIYLINLQDSKPNIMVAPVVAKYTKEFRFWILVYLTSTVIAGNTKEVLESGDVMRDHPRYRGKHYLSIIFNNQSQGSPPLSRETH